MWCVEESLVDDGPIDVSLSPLGEASLIPGADAPRDVRPKVNSSSAEQPTTTLTKMTAIPSADLSKARLGHGLFATSNPRSTQILAKSVRIAVNQPTCSTSSIRTRYVCIYGVSW